MASVPADRTQYEDPTETVIAVHAGNRNILHVLDLSGGRYWVKQGRDEPDLI